MLRLGFIYLKKNRKMMTHKKVIQRTYIFCGSNYSIRSFILLQNVLTMSNNNNLENTLTINDRVVHARSNSEGDLII